MKKLGRITAAATLWGGIAVLGILTACTGPVGPITPDPLIGYPVAAFYFDPPSIEAVYCNPPRLEAGSTVVINGRGSYDLDGRIVWGKLDFGDGSTAEGPWTRMGYDEEGEWGEFSVMREVTYLYAHPGDYTITLTVMDNDGKRASTSRPLVVY